MITPARHRPTHARTLSRSVPGFSVVLGEHPPASVLQRHSHDRPTICAVQRGSFTEFYPGRAVACDARTLKLTPAGEPHWNRFDAVATRGLRIDVDGTRFEQDAAVARILDERVFVPAGGFARLTRGIFREMSAPDEYTGVSLEALLLELLALLGRAERRSGGPRPQAWLRRAEELVRSLYRSQLSVAGIAAEVGVQSTTLARAYRRTYGVTVGQHIRQLRLDFAARALAATETPLAEIAVMAGFYDQSHFSNAFRAQYGTTPGRYRGDMRGGLLHDDDAAHEGVRPAEVVAGAGIDELPRIAAGGTKQG